jgi:hypothetical protein
MIRNEITVRKNNPNRKTMSAIFSKNSDFFLERMDVYDKTLETRKRMVAHPTKSSIIVSIPPFDQNFIRLSITKHSPNKFEDVGNICLDIFFLLSVPSDIWNPSSQ